jgi:flagellar biogenesis protein FliO
VSPITDYLVEAGTTLLAVVVVGALVVMGSRRLAPPSGPLQLVGQLPLGARRAVYLVRVGERVFVLGGSEAGLATLGELPADSVPQSPPAGSQSFRHIWQQLTRPSDAAITATTSSATQAPAERK